MEVTYHPPRSPFLQPAPSMLCLPDALDSIGDRIVGIGVCEKSGPEWCGLGQGEVLEPVSALTMDPADFHVTPGILVSRGESSLAGTTERYHQSRC